MSTLRRLGYWSSEFDERWPRADEFVDLTWDEDERHRVWWYFASGTLARAYRGLSPCRFCGKDNGSREYTDGMYIWPEGLGHYLSEHGVRLPAEVVRHALDRLDEIEAADVDERSWIELAR